MIRCTPEYFVGVILGLVLGFIIGSFLAWGYYMRARNLMRIAQRMREEIDERGDEESGC